MPLTSTTVDKGRIYTYSVRVLSCLLTCYGRCAQKSSHNRTSLFLDVKDGENNFDLGRLGSRTKHEAMQQISMGAQNRARPYTKERATYTTSTTENASVPGNLRADCWGAHGWL